MSVRRKKGKIKRVGDGEGERQGDLGWGWVGGNHSELM